MWRVFYLPVAAQVCGKCFSLRGWVEYARLSEERPMRDLKHGSIPLHLYLEH